MLNSRPDRPASPTAAASTHQPGSARRIAAAAARAAGFGQRRGRSRSPPEPDMRARRQPGWAAARRGPRRWRARGAAAGASRSLRWPARKPSSASASAERGRLRHRRVVAAREGGEDRPGRDRRAGVGQRQPEGGRSSGRIPSPTPVIRQARPARQTGTSAPSPKAETASGSGTSQSRASSRSVAAASAEPPPMPLAERQPLGQPQRGAAARRPDAAPPRAARGCRARRRGRRRSGRRSPARGRRRPRPRARRRRPRRRPGCRADAARPRAGR